MFQSVTQGVLIVGSLAVLAYAAWRGGLPERLSSAVVLAGWLLTQSLSEGANWDRVQYPVLVVDGLAFLWFCGVAVRSRRRWAVFAGGAQLQAVLTHLAMALGWGVGGWIYVSALWIWFALMVLSLGAGTFLEVDRPRLSGNRGTWE